jgi:hypothetical protein
MDLNLKSGHLVFNGFMLIFRKSIAGFVGMWKLRVSQSRIHAFHNEGIPTKLLLRDIV